MHPSGSPTQNLDSFAGEDLRIHQKARGVWNIHQLVVIVQRKESLDISCSNALGGRDTHLFSAKETCNNYCYVIIAVIIITVIIVIKSRFRSSNADGHIEAIGL
jgi:hypothetical protein